MRFTIKSKLVAAFAGVIVLLGVSTFLSLWTSSVIQAELDGLASTTAIQLEKSNEIKADVARTMSRIKNYVYYGNPEIVAEEAAAVDRLMQEVEAEAAALRALLQTDATRSLLGDFDQK